MQHTFIRLCRQEKQPDLERPFDLRDMVCVPSDSSLSPDIEDFICRRWGAEGDGKGIIEEKENQYLNLPHQETYIVVILYLAKRAVRPKESCWECGARTKSGIYDVSRDAMSEMGLSCCQHRISRPPALTLKLQIQITILAASSTMLNIIHRRRVYCRFE